MSHAQQPDERYLKNALQQADRAEDMALQYGVGTSLGLEAYAAAKTIRAQHAHIAELEEGLQLANQSSGAEAYEIACEELEHFQKKRAKEGKDVGPTFSLVEGMSWLYSTIEEMEAAHLRELAAYRTTVENLERKVAELEAAPAAQVFSHMVARPLTGFTGGPMQAVAVDTNGREMPGYAPAAQAVEPAAYPDLPEPLEIKWPELHSHALGCGVEDRGIHDRYEAAEYGWEDGVDRAAQCVPEQIFTADQMRAYVDADRAQRAAPAPAAVAVPDEQAAFEAWAKSDVLDTSADDDGYISRITGIASRAWQARAALAATTPAQMGDSPVSNAETPPVQAQGDGFYGAVNEADGLYPPQSAPQAQDVQREADMFWDSDDGERCEHDIESLIEGYSDGTILKIERAKSLPSITIRVIQSAEGADYEIIDRAAIAASAAQGEA